MTRMWGVQEGFSSGVLKSVLADSGELLIQVPGNLQARCPTASRVESAMGESLHHEISKGCQEGFIFFFFQSWVLRIH